MCDINNLLAEQKTEGMPTVVLEVKGGMINCVRSDGAVHVVILDSDTEGGDEDRIIEVNGEDVYVTEYSLTENAEPGMDGLDPQFVEDALQQVWGNSK